MIWAYVSIGGVGMILLIAGILMVVFENGKKKRCTYKSTAVVCDAKKYFSVGADNHRRMYHAVYEYEYGGKSHYAESTVGSSIAPEIGKQVTVYINPNKPKEYYVNSFAKNFVYWLLIGLGVIFTGAAMALFFIIGR